VTFRGGCLRGKADAVDRLKTRISLKPGQPSIRLFNQTARTCYFGSEHEKFAASSVLPVPLYFATCG